MRRDGRHRLGGTEQWRQDAQRAVYKALAESLGERFSPESVETILGHLVTGLFAQTVPKARRLQVFQAFCQRCGDAMMRWPDLGPGIWDDETLKEAADE
jgi:hypothetical protein